MIFVGLAAMAFFLYTVFQKNVISYFPLYVLLMITMVFYCLKYLHEWYHYFSISSDKKPTTSKEYTVDILTTFCAGEPFDMLKETLVAIQKITYPHTAWCCDEANDPHVKELCAQLNVRHVTRTDKKNAKAGNINNALQFATGELCVVLDPDHVPAPEFLDELVAYFDDASIGFVQIVQAYYNQQETLVAKGAAQQTYQFYGPMMMTMHKYGTVQAIGANCTFRRAALDSIGGHASGLAEDMHTAMKMHAAGWRSVYVSAILTRGLVPATMSSYYKQQLKWSRGTWELLVTAYPRLFTKFTWRQKLHYFTLPFHYLSGIIFFINFLIPVVSLFTGYIPLQMDVLNFFLAAFPLFAMSNLIRYYVQKWVADERERGFHLVGGILQIGAWWIHSVGFIYTILRKKVPYIPTPKNDHESLPLRLNLPNILVALISLTAIVYGLFEDFNPYTVFMVVLAGMQVAFMAFNLSISGYVSGTSKVNGLIMKLRENTWLIIKTHGFLRKYSLRLAFLLIVLFVVAYWKQQQLPDFLPKPLPGLQVFYRGINLGNNISSSSADSILSSTKTRQDIAIISSGISRIESDSNLIDTVYLRTVYEHNAIPLISWQPWQKDSADAINDIALTPHILAGKYDSLISLCARQFAFLDKPIYLRLTYAVSEPEDFKAIWQHVHQKFEEAGADKVIWVWNPPDAATADSYFPGKNYVDWLELNLNDTSSERLKTNNDGFDSLYLPYHSLQLFRSGLPVMLMETTALPTHNFKWWNATWNSIDTAFKEIKSVLVTPGNAATLANAPRASAPIIDKHGAETQQIHAGTMVHNLPFPVKGIVYDKGYHWFRNRHTLNLRIIENDVEAMKKLGANTIERVMPGIYDRDIGKSLAANQMKLIPRFWFLTTPQVIEDDAKMKEQAEKILQVIKENLDKKYVIAWNLGDDVLYNLSNQTYKPDYFYYRRKYITWLADVCRSIRKLDNTRPIIMDLHWDASGRKHFHYYKKHVPEIDRYMLLSDARDTAVVKEPLEPGMAWGKVDLRLWPLIPSIQQSGIVPAWQDIETTDYVTLNGLLDLKGRKKQWYGDVFRTWTNDTASFSSIPDIRILKPAQLTTVNDKLTYHVIYKKSNSWELYHNEEMNIHFEWYLVRVDQYGNTMFITQVGTKPFIELSIPANPQYYRLYVEAISGNDVKMTNTTLNTPLE